MTKFLGSAAIATVLTFLASLFGSVPGWSLPLVAFVTFYLSLTAGMAWERASDLRVEVSPVLLEMGNWDGAIGIFYVLVTNGPIPAKIVVKIVHVESLGIRRIEPSYEGHWRGLSEDFSGCFTEGEKCPYGLVGIFRGADSQRALFIWTKGNNAKPVISPRDVPLAEQGETKVDVVVTCEATAEVRRGKPKYFTFRIEPHLTSPVSYRIVHEPSFLMQLVMASAGCKRVIMAMRKERSPKLLHTQTAGQYSGIPSSPAPRPQQE
jgi:hypothetical protein